MKKLHLISNAHLDPIWQWEWEEGAASALSTFRCAALTLGAYKAATYRAREGKLIPCRMDETL